MKILNVLTLPNNYTGPWFCDFVGTATGIYNVNGDGTLYFRSGGTVQQTLPVGDETKVYSLCIDYTMYNGFVSGTWDAIKLDGFQLLGVPRYETGTFKGEIVIDNPAGEYRVYPTVGDPQTIPMDTKEGVYIRVRWNSTDIQITHKNLIYAELDAGETRAGYLVSEERSVTELSNDTSFHSTESGVSNVDEINRLSASGATTLKETALVATVNGQMAEATINSLADDDLLGIVAQVPAYRTDESRASSINVQMGDLDVVSKTAPYSTTVTVADPLIAIINSSDVTGGLTSTTIPDLKVKFGGGGL